MTATRRRTNRGSASIWAVLVTAVVVGLIMALLVVLLMVGPLALPRPGCWRSRVRCMPGCSV